MAAPLKTSHVLGGSLGVPPRLRSAVLKPCLHGLGDMFKVVRVPAWSSSLPDMSPLQGRRNTRDSVKVSRARWVVQWEELWAGRQESFVCLALF